MIHVATLWALHSCGVGRCVVPSPAGRRPPASGACTSTCTCTCSIRRELVGLVCRSGLCPRSLPKRRRWCFCPSRVQLPDNTNARCTRAQDVCTGGTATARRHPTPSSPSCRKSSSLLLLILELYTNAVLPQRCHTDSPSDYFFCSAAFCCCESVVAPPIRAAPVRDATFARTEATTPRAEATAPRAEAAAPRADATAPRAVAATRGIAGAAPRAARPHFTAFVRHPPTKNARAG
jgi:hypothetical protein